MSAEILINVMPMETRVAVVEHGKLLELMLERTRQLGYVGNIYRGKVARILPGMQAAFIDIGLEKAGFIQADDLFSERSDEAIEHEQERRIERLLHEGQQLLVQVSKNPLGTKGARLTTQLSIASRHLVYMPKNGHVGISQKIIDEEERERLRQQLESIAYAGRGGFIVRTVAEGIDADTMQQDLKFLYKLWDHIEKQAKEAASGSCIYRDLPLHLRIVRDFHGSAVKKISVDSPEIAGQLLEFAESFTPEVATAIETYQSEVPLFYNYGIEGEITQALERKVPLKSGGYLVIDQTEAMTTVDVNTGGFVGRRNLEETIFKTNLEAATVIGRQLRLRNLGGIIIIDFIDMQDQEHQREVLRIFQKVLDQDRVKTAITGVSQLGLVEMTRKRTAESLEHLLCETCPVCMGRGSVKSVTTICHEALRELAQLTDSLSCKKIVVRAAPAVIERFLDEESVHIADLEKASGRTIEFQTETVYSQEHYDIIPL